MKKLLFSLLIFGSLSAQASMLEVVGSLDSMFHEAEVSQKKSYFDALGDLFSKGTVPSPSRISNIAWSGRCFLQKTPNDPMSAGYIFRQKRNANVGPLGENAKAYEAFSYWSPSDVPSFFDNMSIEQVFALFPEMEAMNAKIDSKQITIKFSATENSNLKISGSYLIEELVDTKLYVGPLAKEAIFGRCYYFIPDLNK